MIATGGAARRPSSGRLPRALRRLAGLSAKEGLIWIQLLLMSAVLAVALRQQPLPRVAAAVVRMALHPLLRGLPLFHEAVAADRLDAIADLAAAAVPGTGRCLSRSLLLMWLIHARGGTGRLLVGARRDGDRLGGHAWIESESWPCPEQPEAAHGFPIFLEL